MDDFSPEEMREFNENLNSMNSTMGPLGDALSKLASELKNLSAETQKTADYQEDSRKNDRDGQNKRSQSDDKATEAIETQAKKMAAALSTSTAALGAFSGALISGVDGLSKYGQAITGFGDSAKATGEALGGFSKYVGRAVGMLSQFLDVALKQADAQNQFIKDMNGMGAVVGITTQGLADSAREAGASARDLADLSQILQNSSKALAAFGAGTSDGLKKTIEVMKLSDEQERSMRQYSFTLKEAQAEQAYYLELQRTAGTNLNMQNLAAGTVRERSLKYAKNLRELSSLTGLQASQVKDQQAAAQADMRNKLRNLRDDNEIARLNTKIANETNAVKKAELEAERDSIKERKQVRLDSINEFSATLGAEMAAKLANVIGTGAFDENTKELATIFGRAGVSARDLELRFKGLEAGSDEYTKAMADTQAEFIGGVRKGADDFSESMENAANLTEIGNIVGLTAATIDAATVLGTEKEAREKMLTVEERVRKATEDQADAQKDLVAGLQVLETNVRTSADKFINSMNPFTGVLGASTIGLGFFIGAIAQATIALQSMSAGGMIGQGSNFMGPIKPSKLGKLFSPRNMKIGGGIAAGGFAAYSALSEGAEKNREADTQYAAATAGKDGSTEKGAAALYRAEQALNAQTERNNNVYGTKALGGMGGAAGGASLGAAIGTAILPGIGTAIGGLIGAGLGAYAGSELAEAVALGLTDLEIEALEELNEDDLALMSDEEKDAWKTAHADAQAQLDVAKDLRKLEEKAFDEAKERGGLYDKDLIGNSEVNIKLLATQMAAARTDEDAAALLKMQLEAILKDDDLSAKQQRQVEGELAKLVKLEKDKKEGKEEEKEVVAEKEKDMGRTMDLSPENLAKIFEAQLLSETKHKAEAEVEMATALLASSQALEGITGTTGAGVDPATGIVEVDQIMDSGGALGTDEIGLVGELGPELVEGPANVTSRKDTALDLDYIASMMNTIDKMTGGDKANDDIKGQVMLTQDTVNETTEIMNKAFEAAGIKSPSGASMSEKMSQLEEITKPAKLDTSGAWDFDLDSMSTPQVDIEPEPVEEIEEERSRSTTGFAQRKSEDNTGLAEKIDQLIAVQTEGNAINLKAKNAAVETAESNQKIMQSSIV